MGLAAAPPSASIRSVGRLSTAWVGVVNRRVAVCGMGEGSAAESGPPGLSARGASRQRKAPLGLLEQVVVDPSAAQRRSCDRRNRERSMPCALLETGQARAPRRPFPAPAPGCPVRDRTG